MRTEPFYAFVYSYNSRILLSIVAAFFKTSDEFSGPRAIIKILFLSRGDEAFTSKASTTFFVNLGLYCLAWR